MRYGLRSPGYDCQTCTARDQRNCHNHKQYAETVVSKDAWNELPASLRHVEKFGDLKLFECPLTAITSQTWEIIRIVNNTVDTDGNITCLPYEGAYMDQPEWYRQAVEIVRRERAEHRMREMEQRRGSR